LNNLQKSLHVQKLREALERRGAPPLDVSVSSIPAFFHCPPCFEASAKAAGFWLVERERPSGADAGTLEAYDELSWSYRGPPEERRLVVDHPHRHGLFRLSTAGGSPADALWIWVYEQILGYSESTVVAYAARDPAVIGRFLDEGRRRHLAHEVSEPAFLILDGGCERRRTPAKPVTWNDVLLPDAQKAELEKTASQFFASRTLYREHGIAYRRGVLLAGPPGNGKTTILRAMHGSCRVPVVVSMPDECREKPNLRRAFDRAADLAPCVLCFEDVDSLIGEGAHLSQFLNLLDGLEPIEGILVVATTNRPERIDPAIARRPSRFDRVFAIAPPDRALRARYLTSALGASIGAETVARLAGRTDGYSVAFLKELVIQARLAALTRGERDVLESDLEVALGATRDHQKLAAHGLQERAEVGFR
jgi:AAA+ superfamily predicted ATPase